MVSAKEFHGYKPRHLEPWGPLDPKIWGGAESMKESDSYLELSNKSIIDTAEFTFI